MTRPSAAPEPAVAPLPPDVLQALEQGRTIEAIKRLRLATGLGLKEAKEAIERHVGGEPSRPRPSLAAMASLPFAVAEALKKGDRMEAIRLMREQGGLGLKEAKDAVDAYSREQSAASELYRAPGEVPRRAGVGWVVLVLAFIAVLLLVRRLFADPG